MGETINLQQFRQKVDMYFDNALSKEDEKELLNVVQCNPQCQKVFEQEETYRKFIRTKIHRPNISPDFIRSLKDKIRVV